MKQIYIYINNWNPNNDKKIKIDKSINIGSVKKQLNIKLIRI